ncbi:MAG: hypothetical protein ACI865_002153 [Flavobacteriaceae bacterium]|jgi:hypothetical protein
MKVISQQIGLLLVFLFLFSSCKKESFTHAHQELTIPCECNEFADSIVGNYQGRLIEKTLIGWGGTGAVFDTITDSIVSFSVTRIYPELSFVEDSARCYFSISEFFNEPISIGIQNGFFTPGQYSTQYFTFDGEFHMSTYTYPVDNIYWYHPFIIEAQRQ